MNFYQPKKFNTRGFTLIEGLVTIFVISIISLGLFSLINYALRISAENKYRVEAINIARAKMEKIRNLAYSDVGLVSGIPNGTITEYEYDTRGNKSFTTHHFIRYYDDPYDSVEDGGTDLLGNDYKIATVEVSWAGPFGNRDVTLFTKIVPPTEEMSEGGGLLKINITDVNLIPISFASVQIVNSSTDPIINFTAITNENGRISFPSAPPELESYEIRVSKVGYDSEKTYDPAGNNPLNPIKGHLSVAEGVKTEENFTISALASLKITTVTESLPENWQINTTSTEREYINPALDIDNGNNIYFAWQNYTATSSYIHLQKYDANKQKVWAFERAIAATSTEDYPDISVTDNGNIYLTWNSKEDETDNIYLFKLNLDGNNLWGNPIKINENIGSENHIKPKVAIFQDGINTTTTICWQDTRNGNWDIYLQTTDKNGSFGWTNDLLVNTDGGLSDQINTNIAIDSAGNIYIVWEDERNGDKDIYAAKYDWFGNALWGNNLKINTDSGTTNQENPDITIDSNNNIYIVWEDERNGDKDIYAAKYDADGVALFGSDLKINENSALTQKEPAIAMDLNHNRFFVLWTDEREGNADIYSAKFDENGGKLWTEDLRININVGGSAQSAPDLAVNTNDVPITTWIDARSGINNIFATHFNDPGTSSPLGGVALIITGSRAIGCNNLSSPCDDPIFKYVNEFATHNITGELEIELPWDDGYSITVSSTSAYEIILSNPIQPVSLAPEENKEAILYLE